MQFRILRFRKREGPGPDVALPSPAAGVTPTSEPVPEPRPSRPRPSTNHDQQWWFDALHNDGRLLIQRCVSCRRFRHPTGPMCRSCQSLEWIAVEAPTTGTIYSFVVTHYPQVPSFDYPLPVLLVELDPLPGADEKPESVRVLGNPTDTDPATLAIGQRVEVVVQKVDDELSLPFFRVVVSEVPS